MAIDSVNAIPYSYIVSHMEECITVFKNNAQKARKHAYDYGEAVALNKLSLAYGLSGKHDQSVEALLRAARIFERLNAYAELSMVYGGYGYGIKRRDLHSANFYMRKGIHIAESHGLKENLATLYDNYGVLKQMEDKSDSAYFYFSNALTLKRQLKDSVGIPYSLNKLAEMLAQQGKFKKALSLMRESDAIRNREEGEFGRAENLVYYAGIFTAMGNYDKAIDYYHRAIALGRPLQYKYLVQYAYQQLTELFEKTGKKGEALEHYRQYVAYKDSVNNAQVNNKIAELQIAYETEKKDRQLSEKELQLRNKSLQLLGALVSVGLLILVFFIWYRSSRQKQRHLLQTMHWKSQLQRSALEQKLVNEKLRISRDLHDNIGSNLTFIINALDNLARNGMGNGVTQKLASIGTFGRETLTDLRDTIWAMKHDAGDTALLVMKVQGLKQKLNEAFDRPEITAYNRLQNTLPLSSAAMLNIYRLIQEALQNAVKHANATSVKVIFSEEEDNLKITVEDDGQGFDINNIAAGNGLQNMRMRCQALNGIFTCQTSSAGTCLSFVIPKTLPS